MPNYVDGLNKNACAPTSGGGGTGGLSPGVEDITALRAVTNADYADKNLIGVVSPPSVYIFDSDSTANPDGFLIVKPNDIPLASPGRWLLTGPTASVEVVRVPFVFNSALPFIITSVTPGQTIIDSEVVVNVESDDPSSSLGG